MTIEISETKENYEIIGWRFASMKSIQQIKNRAEREGGQVLVTESNAQGSSGLHDLSSGSISNIPQSDEKSSDNLEFSNKRLHNQINPAVRDGVVRQEKSSTSRHRLVMAQYKNFSLLTGQ